MTFHFIEVGNNTFLKKNNYICQYNIKFYFNNNYYFILNKKIRISRIFLFEKINNKINSKYFIF